MINGAKVLSTIHPAVLLDPESAVDEPPESLEEAALPASERRWITFVRALKRKRDELYADYVDYVLPVAGARHLDTYETVVLRGQFYIAWLCVTRLYETYKRYYELGPVRRRRDEAATELLAALNLPETDLYHHAETGLDVGADLVHKLYAYYFTVHLARLCPANSCTVPTDPLLERCGLDERNTYVGDDDERTADAYAPQDPTRLRMLWRSIELDRFLRYACRLASYPVLPADLLGTLVAAADRPDLGNLDVLTPGVESRIHVRTATDPRTCIACRIETLQQGHVDRKEQRTRIKCRCLSRPVVDDKTQQGVTSQYEESYALRGGILTRLLTVAGAGVKSGRGCGCRVHKALVLGELMKLKTTLEEARVC